MIIQVPGLSYSHMDEGHVCTYTRKCMYTIFLVCHPPSHSQAQEALNAHTVTGDPWTL